MSEFLTHAELDVVMQTAELLMPDEGRLPSVEASGMRERYLDAALTARVDCLEPLREYAGEALVSGAASALQRARDEGGELWDVVTTILPGAYFLSASVRDGLGYHGQTADRIDPDATPDYQELLGAVAERGPFYRPTPLDGANQPTARQQ